MRDLFRAFTPFAERRLAGGLWRSGFRAANCRLLPDTEQDSCRSIRRCARTFEIVGNHRLMRRKRARRGCARGDESRRHAFVKRNALPKHVSAIGRA
jgi:hypothetical protein